MADMVAIIGAGLTLLGSIFGLLAAIGLLRFPDLLTRLHAVALAGGIGGMMSFLAIIVVSHDLGMALRALLGLAFLLLTTPVSAHLLARITHWHDRENAVETVVDDLRA